MYGISPFRTSGAFFSLPVVGLIGAFRTSLAVASWRWVALNTLGLLTLLVDLGVLVVLFRRRLDPVLRGVLVVGAILLLIGGVDLHIDFWGNQRVFVLLPLGVWLACVQLRRPRILVPLAAPALILLAVVVQAWFKQGV
jgi:hypothetical protein